MKDAQKIWNQKGKAVLIKKDGQKLRLRIPPLPDQFVWLRGTPNNHKPVWSTQYRCWELPNSRMNELVRKLVKKFGSLHLIQSLAQKKVCASACWNATGFDCDCGCLGANHGQGHGGDNWIEIFDTFAVAWGKKEMGFRVLTRLDVS